MRSGQVKEAVKGTCAICGNVAYISFYSYAICRNCHACPSCGNAGKLKTFTFVCVETKEVVTGIKCDCGATFKERSEMDTEILLRHRMIPHHICKICGADVTDRHGSLCASCSDCPTCRSGVTPSENTEDGSINCPVCGDKWKSRVELEGKLLNRIGQENL